MTQGMDWDEVRRYAKSGERAPGWPENVKGISISGAMLFGIDDQNQLYWDGTRVEISQRVTLTWLQKIVVTLVSIAIIAQGIDAGRNFGCKVHWWGCLPQAENAVPAISPQFTPPTTSPQSAPQQLLPGTKFQQR